MSELRTIEPTARRLKQAQRRGLRRPIVDLGFAVALVLLLGLLPTVGPWLFGRWLAWQQQAWALMAQPSNEALLAWMAAGLGRLAAALAVVATLVWLLMLSAQLLQGGWNLGGGPPQRGRSSLLASGRQALLSLLKLAALLAWFGWCLATSAPRLLRLSTETLDAAGLMRVLGGWLGRCLLPVALGVGLWTALAFGLQRWRFWRALRMTRREAMLEQREQHGHPLHRQQRRRFFRQPA